MADTAATWIEDCVCRWERPLTLYAWRILGDADDARDAVQDVFMRLCRQERAAIEDRLAEWLFTVCRNCAIDRKRKDRPMRSLAQLQLADPHLADARLAASAPAEPPSAAMERAETMTGVLGALAALPPNQQECIRLKFQQGLSYQEISRITSLSVTNVGYLIHIGIKTLRARLAPTFAPAAGGQGTGAQS
jgi:RNA polymerase sigma-70 factor (ECF subfamily)